MSKLIAMRGLPASGKSTIAEELIAKHGYATTVRINKDLIRTMLHYDRFSGKAESATAKASLTLVEMFLKEGLNVIVDDTNLNPKVIKMYQDVAARLPGVKFEIHDVDTPLGECLFRDRSREKSVGKDVIIKMALQYQEFLKGERFIICDLDGTLCDIKHRLKYASGPEKDWQKFFAGIPDDTLRQDVVDQLVEMSHREGARIIYVSARPEEHRQATLEWFETHGVEGHYMLFMRPNHDKRDDTLVKAEIYDKYLKNLDIVGVFDDRPKIIRMWREKGLNVYDVGDGIEF